MADNWDDDDKAPVRSAPQKSWADDDDDFTPVRPTTQKEVTYPAPQRTAAGPSRSGGFGGATAAARDFSDRGGARGEGDFSNFGSRRSGGGREGGRVGEGGYRGRGRGRGRGGDRQRGGGGVGRQRVEFHDKDYVVEPVETWEGFDLKEPVMRGIFSKGFEKPSECQKLGIKPLLDGKNVLLQAQSGHGKTAIFATAVLNNIDTSVPDKEAIQAIVLVPNRDLARQVTAEIEALGQYLDPPLRIQCCVGSPYVKTEEARDERIALVKSLKAQSPHVLVGTMGRICDLAEGRDRYGPVIWLRNTKFLVLDEADEMLFDCRNPSGDAEHGGTAKDSSSNYVMLQGLARKLSPTTQIALCSATFSPETTKAAQEIFPRDTFVLITLQDHELNRANIQQFYVVMHRNDERVWLPELMQLKLSTMEKLVSIFANGQIYCFCTNKDQVEMVMKANDYPGTRYTVNIEDFKAGRKSVLVCTNALARGLDVQAASVVINFDLCDPQRYMQRIGRVGRFGRAGTAISLIPPYQVDKSSGRNYSIQHITEAYHNTINRWDFLQGDYPPRDPFVLQLPGFGIEQDLLNGLKEGGGEGGVDELGEGVAGIKVEN